MAFNCNYGHILYRIRDNARYWSKIAIFYTPPALRGPMEFRHEGTLVVRTPCKNFVIIGSVVLQVINV